LQDLGLEERENDNLVWLAKVLLRRSTVEKYPETSKSKTLRFADLKSDTL